MCDREREWGPVVMSVKRARVCVCVMEREGGPVDNVSNMVAGVCVCVRWTLRW